MIKNDVQATTDFEKTQMAERRTEVVGRDFVGEIVHETITRNNCRKGNRVKFQIISLDGRKKNNDKKSHLQIKWSELARCVFRVSSSRFLCTKK